MLVSSMITELIRETGGDTDNSDLSPLWLSFITAALRRFPEKVRCRAIVASTTDTLSASSRTISLPSDHEYPKTMWRVFDNQQIPITLLPDITFHRYYSTEAGIPQFVRILGANYEFEVPADETYTIGFDYYKDISDSLATTDTVDRKFVEPAKEWAKYIYYLDYEEDAVGKADKHYLIGKDLLDEIEGRDMEQELGGYVDDE